MTCILSCFFYTHVFIFAILITNRQSCSVDFKTCHLSEAKLVHLIIPQVHVEMLWLFYICKFVKNEFMFYVKFTIGG